MCLPQLYYKHFEQIFHYYIVIQVETYKFSTILEVVYQDLSQFEEIEVHEDDNQQILALKIDLILK